MDLKEFIVEKIQTHGKNLQLPEQPEKSKLSRRAATRYTGLDTHIAISMYLRNSAQRGKKTKRMVH